MIKKVGAISISSRPFHPIVISRTLFTSIVVIVVIVIVFISAEIASFGGYQGGKMNMTPLDDANFLDLNALAYVRIENSEDDIKAFLMFKHGGSENLAGDAARTLYHLLAAQKEDGEAEDEEDLDSPALPSKPRSEDRSPIRLTVDDFPISRTLSRNKAWFYLRDEKDREYFLAFVNAKGSCSLRKFDGETGIFRGKQYAAGNYQDQFAKLIEGAIEVTVDSQPNLERDCSERLPDRILAYLRQQRGK